MGRTGLAPSLAVWRAARASAETARGAAGAAGAAGDPGSDGLTGELARWGWLGAGRRAAGAAGSAGATPLRATGEAGSGGATPATGATGFAVVVFAVGAGGAALGAARCSGGRSTCTGGLSGVPLPAPITIEGREPAVGNVFSGSRPPRGLTWGSIESGGSERAASSGAASLSTGSCSSICNRRRALTCSAVSTSIELE